MAEPARLPTGSVDPLVAMELFGLSGELQCAFRADGTGILTTVNPAWTKLLGWSAAELTTRPYVDFVHPDDVAATLAAASRLEEGHEVEEFRNRYRHCDGSYVWLQWCARMVGEPPVFVAIGRDISDRWREEQSIAALVQRLQTLVEDERGRIAGELHDYALQTLIAALMQVRSALEVEDPEGGDAAAAARLGHGMVEVERLLASTIDSLRGVMNGLRPLWVEHLEFDDVVAQLARQVERDFPITVDLELSVEEPVPARLRLAAYRILREVIVNAAKHAGAAEVAVQVRVRDGRIEAVVTDEGSGFPTAIDVVDVPLGGGSGSELFGLGLSLALERVALNGGSYRLTSQPGIGTTMAVRMPLRGSDGLAPEDLPALLDRD